MLRGYSEEEYAQKYLLRKMRKVVFAIPSGIGNLLSCRYVLDKGRDHRYSDSYHSRLFHLSFRSLFHFLRQSFHFSE